jgi:hypothetical protein
MPPAAVTTKKKFYNVGPWSGCPYGFDHLADESDCFVFYHCFESVWGTVMIPKTCGPFLMFNPGVIML